MGAQKRLRTHVHVHQDDGTVNVYGPDDTDIPDADLQKIGDHCFLDEGEQPVVDVPAGQQVVTAEDGDESDGEKPKPRSSRRRT